MELAIAAALVLFSPLWIAAQHEITTKDYDIFSWRHVGPWTFSGRITDFAVPKGQSQPWKKLAKGLPQDIKSGWNGIAIYPKDPNIVYIRYDEEGNLGLSESESSALFRERRLFKDGFYFNKFKGYKIPSALAKLVEFEPLSAETEKELVETRAKISKDMGKTFNDVPWFETKKCHVDVRGMWIDPLNSHHILNGNDGGVSETWDGGKH